MNADLLGRDELEERSLVKLHSVVKITHATVNGTSLLNLKDLRPRQGGRSSRAPEPGRIRRWPNDLQLHADQPLFGLASAISPSLSAWTAGKGYPGRHALRARV